ncbi:MAG: DsbA family oxidoreductase [Polyangiaceae bacterium]
MALSTVKLEVVSDVVCPWCYLGKRRLAQALDQVKGRIDVSVRWRPFQLDPSVPTAGKPYKANLAAKFGSMTRVEAAWDRLREFGRADGIDFKFENITTMPNTLDAHRLIAAADLNDLAEPVLDALFKAHFTDGRDLAVRSELLSIATQAGLDADTASAALDDQGLLDATRTSIQQASRMGVTGVPTFIVGRQGVSGAQPVEVLVSLLERAAQSTH